MPISQAIQRGKALYLFDEKNSQRFPAIARTGCIKPVTVTEKGDMVLTVFILDCKRIKNIFSSWAFEL